jgi:uncharacterized lipoprotein YbaY/heat shock protein HslJ
MKSANWIAAILLLIVLSACDTADHGSDNRETEPLPANISGLVNYRERIALTQEAVLEVSLQDVSRQDTEAVLISQQSIKNPGQVPIEFNLEFDRSLIDERMSYAISARLYEGKKLMFVNDEHIPVLTRGAGNTVDILLKRIPEYNYRFKGLAVPKNEPKPDEEKHAGIQLQGMFRYMADAPLFRDCRTNRSFPVAMEGAYIELERAYLNSGVEPGQELMVSISGRYMERPAMEGNHNKVNLIVDKYHKLLDEKECNFQSQSGLTGTYWKLVRLGERTITTPEGMREAHMILGEDDQRVSGNAACNNFFGQFSQDLDKIRFSALGSTMMACPEGMETERDFLKALERATRFTIEGEILELFEGEQSLARLEAVYFQ